MSKSARKAIPSSKHEDQELSDPEVAAATEHQFSMKQLGLRQLRDAIHAVPAALEDEEMTTIHVVDAAGQGNALMRINHPVKMKVDGSLGNYAFALCSEIDVRTEGRVGHGVCEGMASGTVRVKGDAGDGAGAAMTGGTLAIYGSAGHRCGGAMRGGGIFVRGDVGDECGVGALGGMVVIGGNAGENLGDAMNNVTIFIRGSVKSLASGVTEAPLRKREQLRLGLMLINASIRGDSKDFRRIVPVAMLEAEEAGRSEVNPNWR